MMRRFAWLSVIAALLAGCAAQVVVPGDDGGRRAALCVKRAEAEVPGTWAVVEELAAKSAHPGLVKVHLATLLYTPGGLGMGWLIVGHVKREHYDRAFDRCLVETMPAARQ